VYVHGAAAAEEISLALFPWLRDRLIKRLGGGGIHLISDGATTALCAYFHKPEMFDPSRQERLDLFLEGVARLNVGHLLRGEMRHKATEADAGKELSRYSVELCPRPGNTLVEDECDDRDKLEGLVMALAIPLDRTFVALWKQGEWHTEPFAKLLGLAEQPPKTQAKAVKQTKDRIIKILQREFASWPASERGNSAAA
jgi:hypothetical protein